MKTTMDICELAGFRITQTLCFEEGILVKTFFNIRKANGEIVSRNYDYLDEPFDLLSELAETT